MITTSPIGSPCLRNVFLIERADPGDGRLLRPISAVALQTLPILVLGFDDDVLHYGQNLRIKLCPFSESEAKLTANSPAKSTDIHRQTHAHIPIWTSRISTDAYLHSEMDTGLAAAKFSRRALGCTRLDYS